ncbi:hypothetical protein ACWAT4_14960 [Bradyrhizobium manausense]
MNRPVRSTGPFARPDLPDSAAKACEAIQQRRAIARLVLHDSIAAFSKGELRAAGLRLDCSQP